MWDFLKKYKYGIYLFFAFGFLGIGLAVLIRFLWLVSDKYETSSDFSYEATQTVGVFIGGVVPVFVSIATVLLVYITFKSNREEFKKISDANNFQQFNTTFENMCKTLENIIEDNLYDKIHKIDICVAYVFTIEKKLVKALKPPQNMTLANEIFEKSQDTLLITTLKNIRYEDYKTEMRILISALLIIFTYVEEQLSINPHFKENEDYYLFRLKKIISEKYVQKTIMFNGFVNERLKKIINKYNLLEGLLIIHEIEYSYCPTEYIEDLKKAYYQFSFLSFYDESAFNKD